MLDAFVFVSLPVRSKTTPIEIKVKYLFSSLSQVIVAINGLTLLRKCTHCLAQLDDVP